MMLLQKPQPALSSPRSMTLSHRRQTSAPVVVVQPTRIPGLLSLSKPSISSPQRHQQRHNPKNAPKQALTTSATGPSVVRAQATLTPAAQIYTAPATPSPQSRGRAQEKPSKDKKLLNKRSPSQSSLRSSGKHNGRQPSPPIPSTMMTSHKQKPSQAEVPVNFANHFDPFVDQSTPTPSPSPRKQPQQSQTKAIPVPVSSSRPSTTIARSDPLPIPSARQQRHQRQRPSMITRRAFAIQEFPICDDMSEIADNDAELSTPIARRLYEGAPLRSAPISTLEFFSPSAPLSLPSPQQKTNEDWSRSRKHRRTPSDGGVFHMSSDEEVSSGPGGAVLNRNPNTKAPLTFKLSTGKTGEMNMTPARAVAGMRAGVVDGSPMNMSRSAEKAAFFASSVFLNSPSPDELPDPLLL